MLKLHPNPHGSYDLSANQHAPLIDAAAIANGDVHPSCSVSTTDDGDSEAD